MNKANVDLSICIVTMNSINVIKNCIDSIYYNQPRNYSFELIVVDNCSTDGTVDLLNEYKKRHKQIKLIISNKVHNYAVNNNIAINNSSGKIILILNPDTIIHIGTLDYIMDYLMKNKEVGISICKLLYSDGSFQPCARRFPQIPYIIASRLNTWKIPALYKYYDEYLMSKGSDIQPKEVDWVLGAAMFVKREVFEDIGLFDEKFILYSEDSDLCFRAKKHGWKIMYVPNVSITHLYARTAAKKLFSKYAFLQVYTTFLFYMKNYWGIIR